MRTSEAAKANASSYQRAYYHRIKTTDQVRYEELLKYNRERHKAWAAKKLSEDPEYFRKRNKERLDRTFDQRRRRNLMACYGITEDQYRAMEVAQKGCCAICGTDKPRGRARAGKLRVDHDHKTKQIRGLLCGTCNSAIGLLRDDPKLLIKAAQYIESFMEVAGVVK